MHVQTLQLKPGSHIHFVGIGGIGMSAAAGLAAQHGYRVSGSDAKEIYNPALAVLKEHEIPYYTPYAARALEETPADIYVISAGETDANPELAYIHEKDLPYIGFAELLAYLYAEKLRIAVVGTHGKSTTSALLGSVLREIDDSSFFVGAVLTDLETNFYAGTGHYLVLEGDEYINLAEDPTPKFHYYKPDAVLFNNLEYDHPDVYETFDAMRAEFQLLIDSMPIDGLLAYNADDIETEQLAFNAGVKTVGFGLENGSIRAGDITYHEQGTNFVVECFDLQSGVRLWRESYQMQLFGLLNVRNALGVISLLRSLGFTHSAIALAIAKFKGIKRRLQKTFKNNNLIVFDDYAHHPTAVKETLKAIKQHFPDHACIAIFEPHTFSRTAALLPELSTAFNAADYVVMSEIYPAREKFQTGMITSTVVRNAIQAQNSKLNITLVKNKTEAAETIKKISARETKPCVVVVMAVGSFNTLAHELNT